MESNHHSAGPRGYSALSSPLLGVRKEYGRRDRLPATGGRDVAVCAAPEPAVTHRRSCRRVSAPPPPHRSALEASRSQLHVGPALCTSPVPSLPRPVRRRAVLGGLRGWDSNPRSRAHEARGDGRSPTALSGRLESNQRSPAPETGGVAKLPHGQLSIESTTVESNHARPPYQSGASPIGLSSMFVREALGSPPYGQGTPLKASPSAPQLPGRATGAARELHPAPRGHGPRARSLALRRSLAGRSRTPVPPR